MDFLKFNVSYDNGKKVVNEFTILPKKVNGVLFKELKLNHEYPKIAYLGTNKKGEEQFADLIIEDISNLSKRQKDALIKQSTFNMLNIFFTEQEEENDPDVNDTKGLKRELAHKLGAEYDEDGYSNSHKIYLSIL